jgi:hypothetical protein
VAVSEVSAADAGCSDVDDPQRQLDCDSVPASDGADSSDVPVTTLPAASVSVAAVVPVCSSACSVVSCSGVTVGVATSVSLVASAAAG